MPDYRGWLRRVVRKATAEVIGRELESVIILRDDVITGDVPPVHVITAIVIVSGRRFRISLSITEGGGYSGYRVLDQVIPGRVLCPR